jgi:predicted RNase H-like nuclease (RuvC/YqgF family)
MTSAPDKFAELETRILRTIELVKTTRLEKDQAQKDLMAARATVARLEQEIEHLRRERDQVKNKIETLLETLAEFSEETVV